MFVNLPGDLISPSCCGIVNEDMLVIAEDQQMDDLMRARQITACSSSQLGAVEI